MTGLGKTSLNKILGLLFLQWGFYEKKYFSLTLFSHRWKGDLCFLLAIDVPANVIDRSLILHALYKQRWCGWYTVLTGEGLSTQTHSPGELEDEDHSPDKSCRLSPKRFSVFSRDGEWGKEKKEEHQREGPVCGQQAADRVTNSVVKEKSHVAVSILVYWAVHPGLAYELKWGLDSLFHRFSMPQTVSLFLESSFLFCFVLFCFVLFCF